MRILVFGDSITQGFNDPNGGWVEHLKRDYLQRKVKGDDAFEIFNLGISGDTSIEVLNRMENEIAVRRWPNDPVMTILAVGVNDSTDKHGKRLCSPDGYKANIYKLLDTMTRMSDMQLVVGLTPCVNSLLDPASWSENDLRADNQRIFEYEQMLSSITQERNINFVPIWETITSISEWESIFPDGLHPNVTGHKLIYNEVKKVLEAIKG